MALSFGNVFENDAAEAFLDFLRQAEDPERVINRVFEAVLQEREHIKEAVMQVAIAGAGVVALSVHPTGDVGAECCLDSIDLEKSATEGLRPMAIHIMERASQEWTASGHNRLFGEWLARGNIEERLQELHVLNSILVGDTRPEFTLSGIDAAHVGAGSNINRQEVYRAAALVSEEALEALEGDLRDPLWNQVPLSREAIRFTAGAVVYASRALIDGLYDDLQKLEDNKTVADIDVSRMEVLKHLPWRFAEAYNNQFGRRFMIAAFTVTRNVGSLRIESGPSIAEGLAAMILLHKAATIIDLIWSEDELEQAALISRLYRLLEASEGGVDVTSLYVSDSFQRLASVLPFLRYQPEVSRVTRALVPPDAWFRVDGVSQKRIHPYLSA